MEIFLLAVAFVFGFLVKQLGLPPLVGFLCAGFALNLLDFGSSQFLEELANVGILLLLFSIGLKVQIKKLFEAQIWGTASLHMVITTAVLSILLKALGSLSKDHHARFRREAEVAADLDDPAIVRVEDHGEHQGRLYTVMEALAGPSLQSVLAEIQQVVE